MDWGATLRSWVANGVWFRLDRASISFESTGGCNRCRYSSLIGIEESWGRARSETWILLQEWLLKLVTVIIFFNNVVCKEEAADMAIVQGLLVLLWTLRQCISISGSSGPLWDLWSYLWRALIVVFSLNIDYECWNIFNWRRHRWAFFMEEVLIWLGSDACDFCSHFLRTYWCYILFWLTWTLA